MSDRVNVLFTYENHESLIADLKDIVFDLTENYKRKRIEQSSAIKHKVVNYVQDHYKDGALSLELLSSEFNLSFPYINKIFKEETGNTFKIYLTAIRFSSIKKQLRTTNTPIIEIINEHGYMDSANFMRKFKVAEGMTMGQYRSGHSLPLPLLDRENG
jgi:two-component system, response regulator YesN